MTRFWRRLHRKRSGDRSGTSKRQTRNSRTGRRPKGLGLRTALGCFGLVLVPTLMTGCASSANAQPKSHPTRHAARSTKEELVGTEETMTSVVPSPDMVRMMQTSTQSSKAIPGTTHVYSVEESPPVAVMATTAMLVTPGQPVSSARTSDSSCVSYQGTGLMNGTGWDSSCTPLSIRSIQSKSPALIIPDWPAKGNQVYAWTHLPSHVKYVTYSYKGMDRTWVEPVNGTALLSVPRPAAFDGDYAQWHSAPFGLLRAVAADGRLVEEQYAPRISGDDVPKIP
jgi:hypothetical protein